MLNNKFLFIAISISSLFSIINCGKKEEYILLKEIIPGAKIISQNECILEYQGKRFIIGPGDFKKKRDLIYELDLLKLEGPLEIDLRFRRQVILRRR
uniref:Uncharacterized protein n=1 Tax=candidate division WOR-3 bacterium TaxID=2052148 RepID=A0A7C4THS6_UNCW3